MSLNNIFPKCKSSRKERAESAKPLTNMEAQRESSARAEFVILNCSNLKK